MKHFNHILFPVDFSDRCRAVRPFVRAIASRFKSKVTLLHVIHIPAGWYGGIEAGYPIMFDIPAMEADGRRMLHEFFEDGTTHPVEYAIPAGIKIAVEKQTKLTVSGSNKYMVGQVAAHIRGLKPPEPYKGKGIKYADEKIIRKVGKAAGAGAGASAGGK